MVMRVQRIGDGYGVLLSEEAMETLRLREGAAVEIRPAAGEAARPEHRFATVEEGMTAFYATEPDHRNSYRELAK
jgi:antitoxin component of MazEF toxin-antitoxin module